MEEVFAPADDEVGSSVVLGWLDCIASYPVYPTAPGHLAKPNPHRPNQPITPTNPQGPKTIRVLVARVEPKRANALLKRLHTLLPTPEANVRAVSCDEDCVCAPWKHHSISRVLSLTIMLLLNNDSSAT